MGFLRKAVGMSAVVACVALGVGEGQAWADCFNTAPDCEATMGQCGAECTGCWYLSSGAPTAEEYCDDMCWMYGGVVSIEERSFEYQQWSGEWALPMVGPSHLTAKCTCWSECPLFL